MKIQFLSGNLTNGGAQRVIAVISGKLAEKGHDVSLILFSRNEDEYPISDKVKLISLADNFEDYSKISTTKRLKMVRHHIKATKPDVAIGFLEGGYALYLASFGMKIKKVASARIDPQILMTRKGIRRSIDRAWFKSADKIVVQTTEQIERFKAPYRKNCVVIGNPISDSLITNSPKSDFAECEKIIMIGRLTKQKNYQMALEAVKKAAEKYPQIKLDIFGKGPEEEHIKELIEEMSLENNVRLCGWTQTPHDEMHSHDIFLMTSNYEGMPNSLMEAMAIGLPCISTNCPTGPKDLITDNENGYLVPVGDSEALASRLLDIIEMTPEQRKAMGEKARKTMIEQFNSEIIAQKWEELIFQLARSK